MKVFIEKQFEKAGIVKGSKDHDQFDKGMMIINKQSKLSAATRNEMIATLREFLDI